MTNYFAAQDQGEDAFYRVEGPDLKDTPGVRRDLVNLFKSAYMPEQTRIDFDRWRALAKQGYCYAPAPGPPEGARAMAIDFSTRNGLITGLAVGSLPWCQGKEIGPGLGNDQPSGKVEGKAGGC